MILRVIYNKISNNNTKINLRIYLIRIHQINKKKKKFNITNIQIWKIMINHLITKVFKLKINQRLLAFIKNKFHKMINRKFKKIRKSLMKMKMKIYKVKKNQPCKIMKMSKVFMINLFKIVN